MSKINNTQIFNRSFLPAGCDVSRLIITDSVSDSKLLATMKYDFKANGYPLNPRAVRNTIKHAKRAGGFFQHGCQVYSHNGAGWVNHGVFNSHGVFIANCA